MGRVYRAYDTRLQRRVALKVLNDTSADEAGAVTVALREARAAAAIAHPNATAVYDAHEVEGTSFIVMEFVSGTSLRALIDGPPVPLPIRVRWLIDTAAALTAAHRTGIVHRDVKPENVMVRNDGLVKVLDFGVARFTLIEPSGAHVTSPSGARIAGTPAYMSPEQIRGEEIDGRADQFGWAVLAYELLTGHLPWRTARDVVGYIAAVVTEHPAPPSTLAPEIPPAIDAAILRALAKRPEDRFPTILSAAAELAPFARASLSMPVVDVLPHLDPASHDPGPQNPPVTAPPADAARPSPQALSISASVTFPGDPDGEPSRLSPPPSESRVREVRWAAQGRAGTMRPTPDSTVRAPPASAAPRWLTEPYPGEGVAPSPSPTPSQAAPLSSAPVPPPPPRSNPGSAGAQTRPHVPRMASAALRLATEPVAMTLHAPDFDVHVDVEAHLALLPAEATCKGLFAADVLLQVSRVALERDVVLAARIPERRYVAFRDYPLADQMRLAVAATRVLYPRYSLGEGLRRLGHSIFDAVLATHVGRSIFGVLGRDVEPILLAGPKAFGLMVNVGQVTVEKTGPRTFVFHARDLPVFLETYQIGVLEGVLRHCGERGRVRVAVEGLAHGTLELSLA